MMEIGIFLFSRLVFAQLVSAGTFQVLKLPLGFIRVLEWVSWIHFFFCTTYINPILAISIRKKNMISYIM